MKLSKLYSNKKFKNINFNDGLNLVLAKVTKKLDLHKSSHNLGKTTLIALIDFMLLKEVKEEHVFKLYQDKFAGYTFYIELLLNSGKFLTIRRSVENNTKISFKLNDTSNSMVGAEEWDKLNFGLDKSIEVLNEYLAFDVLKSWDYRKSVTYFLRSQKDYNNVFQLDKFRAGKHIHWKPFMFDLLGFHGDLLTEKYTLDEEIENQNNFVSKIKKQFSVDTEEVDKITGAIELNRSEQKELQEQIDNFNFYQQERELSKELIEDVEKHISSLNSMEYNLEYDLEKARDSFSTNISFDIVQLKQIYEEAKIFFPENLVKDYQSLEDFNKRITAERDKFLGEKIIILTEQVKTIRKDLQAYDRKRVQILSVLKDKDSFKKFKKYQVDLTKIEGEISRLEEKLISIDRISALNEQTSGLVAKLDKLIKDITIHISSQDNKIFPEIRKSFNNIFRYIFNTPALIYIEPNRNGNIDFKVDVTKENEIDITGESKGNTYEKILCISFDIAVLAAYAKKSFYRFVYHDGALEGLDNRKKLNYIKIVREYCTKYNLQYIFTSIEDDIPKEILNTFTKQEICLTLDDSGDSGKLFEMSF